MFPSTARSRRVRCGVPRCSHHHIPSLGTTGVPALTPKAGGAPLSPARPRRQQRRRPGALGRAAPTRGAGAAAGADQVHKKGAAVPLPRLQERECPGKGLGERPQPHGAHLVPLLPPQECPSGRVDEETFTLIYAQFFPQGGEWGRPGVASPPPKKNMGCSHTPTSPVSPPQTPAPTLTSCSPPSTPTAAGRSASR